MDLSADPGQWTPLVHEGAKAVSILSPAAQVTALVVVGALLGLLIWTRRPARSAGPGEETTKLVIAAMSEQAQAVGQLATQVHHVVERVDRALEAMRVLVAQMQAEREKVDA